MLANGKSYLLFGAEFNYIARYCRLVFYYHVQSFSIKYYLDFCIRVRGKNAVYPSNYTLMSGGVTGCKIKNNIIRFLLGRRLQENAEKKSGDKKYLFHA